MRKTARWLAALAFAAALLASIPVAVIETACTRPREPAPIATPNPDRRPETNSYLSFPEWYIVYAYQDLAGILRDHDEAAYAYIPGIAGYWTSFCGLNRVATARGDIARDEKIMLYVIGLSFTVEMGIKGAYETTIGALTAWWRGPVPTPEDRFAHEMAADYAAFLQQTPWYEYGFVPRITRLWHEIPFGGTLRSAERRVALTMEWGGKSLYARAIAALAGLAPADERIRSVIRGTGDLPDSRIQRIDTRPDGAITIETPRYGAFTEIVASLARHGWRFEEIAGNQAILVTALLPPALDLPATRQVFAMPIQSRPGWRRTGLDVPVPELTALVDTLARQGAVFEHVYDY